MRAEDLISESWRDWLHSKLADINDLHAKSAKQAAQAFEDDLQHNFSVLYKIAMRYQDESGQQITPKTLNQLQLRAIDSFMRGPMGFDKRDIDWVISNLPDIGRISLPRDGLGSDSRLADIFTVQGKPLTADQARSLLSKFARAATTRLYEKNRLRARQADRPPARRSDDDGSDKKVTIYVKTDKDNERPAKYRSYTSSQAAAEKPKPAASTWKPGDPIPKRDGTLIQPTDSNYDAMARQYAIMLAQGII